MASLTVALLALSHTAVKAAAIIVDEDHREYYDTAYNSYFSYYDKNRSQDDSVQGTFLETSSSGGNNIIHGYNDGDGISNTPGDNSYTDIGESLTLAEAGIISYHGHNYVAFYLEANQKGTDDGALGNNYYDITKLQIRTSGNSLITSYNPEDYKPGTDLNSDPHLAYHFESSEHVDSLRLYYGSGKSNWDIVLYIPEENFALVNHDPNIPDAEETYIQFYVEYHDTAGADYWGYDRGADIIPEPSSVLLVSLGGLMSLFRRRR